MNSPDPIRRYFYILVGAFLVLTGAIGVLGFRYFLDQKRAIQAEVRNELLAISGLKVQEVVAWRRERLGDARIIAATVMTPAVRQVLAGRGDAELRAQVLAWLQAMVENAGYANAVLVDMGGKIRLSAGQAGLQESHYAALLNQAVRTGDVIFSDIHYDPGLQGAHLGLTVPLRSAIGGQIEGALLLGINPNEFLYPLIQSWPTPSRTAETLLVRREGDEVVYLNELRHRKGAALKLRFPLAHRQLLAVKVVLGQEGIADGVDYRGMPVLGSLRRIPDSPWSMVTKVDAEEIDAPIHQQARWLALIACSLMLTTGAGGGMVWRHLRSRFYEQKYGAELERRALLGHYDYLSRFANDIILLTDETGRIVEANDRASAAYGYEREELIGMPIRDLRDAGDVDAFEKQWAAVDTDSLVFETRHRRRDGITFPVEVSARRIAVEGRAFRQSIIRDTTERKRAEQELRDSQHFVQRIIETTPNLLYIYDLIEHRYLYANREVTEFLGYTPEEVKAMGASVLERLLHPEDSQLVAGHHARFAAADFNQVFDVQYRMQHANGQWRWLHNRDVLFAKTPAGLGRQILGSVQDITEHRQLEQQLRQAQKMEAVGRLAGGIAHDFNNLLMVILGFNTFALDELDSGDPMRDALLQVREAGERAAALTRQLLAFSRKQVLQPQVVDLNKLLTGISKMLGRLIGENIELATVLNPALGAVKVDPGQYEQVIVNLAVNARDAMPNGGRLTIETANMELDAPYTHKRIGVQPGPYVMTAISDTGVGMDAATQNRIFEPFFSTKPADKGTGLGLSTAYGIVKQSGGEIWVYSEPGKGTTFKIYLPRVLEGVTPITKEQPPPELRGTGTVLVVEDDAAVRSFIRKSLLAAGYDVLEASNPAEARSVFQSYAGTIHLLITDIIMPGGSGRELAQGFELLLPGMHVLYISGYTDNAIVHHGVLEEGVEFLQKPFTQRSLVNKVKAVLEGRPRE